MMPRRRRLASTLLRIVVRRLSGADRGWGEAMLRELDVVESEWDALRWAVGGAFVLLRRETLTDVRRRATGVLSGMALAAGVVALCLAGFSRLLALRGGTAFLAEIALPVAVVIAGAVACWRRRRFVAAGLLLFATTFITHVIVYYL